MARITGLATGLDVDTIVKQTMEAYRTKIDTQQQKKDILEIKQKLYRDVIKDAQDLYNKHFDILKSGSLISSKSWQSVKINLSSENAIKVTADSTADAGSYTVSGTSGKPSNTSLQNLEQKIIINGKEFTVEGSNNKEKVTNLNKELTAAGINVSVRYTDFAVNANGVNESGFVFESKILGLNNKFVIGGETGTNQNVTGTNAQITGLTLDMLKSNEISNKVTFKIIEGNDKDKVEKEIIIDISSGSDEDSVKKLLNNALSGKGYTADIDKEGNITLISSTSEKIEKDIKIEIKNEKDGFKPVATQFDNANKAKIKLNSEDLNKSLVINGVTIDLGSLDLSKVEKVDKNSERVEYINSVLKNQKIDIKATIDDENNIIIESNSTGKNEKINLSVIDKGIISEGGVNSNIEIRDNKNNLVYKHNDNTNSVTLDGITFNFTGEIPEDGITVDVTKDASEIVSKVKSFIEDYNAFIEKINKLTTEKRDKSYEPLTSDQKKEMSETEIELWETKVKQGQLRRDSDLMRISNSLQQGMKSFVTGSGLTLKDIGIESVQDYGGTKDGTFKIKEDTLKKAIEDNTEGIMKLFIQNNSSNSSESESYNKTGIMIRLKAILYSETISPQSILSKKVGVKDTSTSYNNTITKAMQEYDTKMKQMETIFSRKEQALYSQYAKLETLMNSYNSQMSYLSQSLGLSTS